MNRAVQGKLYLASFGLLGLLAGAAAAEPVEEFYKGKRMTMVIGFGAGGAYDLYSRLYARHVPRAIPGNPTVVPQNMAGAGSRTATAWVHNVGPKDGTILAMTSEGIPMDQAMNPDQVQFDVRNFHWIGNMIITNSTIGVFHTAGVKTIEDAKTKVVTVGATGTGTPSMNYPQAANSLFGTKFKIITGYPSGNDIRLAMERGELDGMGQNAWVSWKSASADWLRDKKVFILLQAGLKRNADLPDVPLFQDLAKSDEERQLIEVLTSNVVVGRSVFTSPGVPADRVAALRRAFDATMKDAAFLAEAEKAKLDIDPLSGAELQAAVTRIAATPPQVVARVKEAIAAKDVTERPGAPK